VPRPTTVLCIDDDVLFLTLRKALLESHDFRVFTAENGPAGLEIVNREPIDVVVLDYQMSGMDGGVVAAEMHRTHPDIPVLLSSGLEQLPEWVLSIVDGFILKGAGTDTLIKEIERVTISKPKRLDEPPRTGTDKLRVEHSHVPAKRLHRHVRRRRAR
jgi:DNA-binding NtrC family response regulator